MIDTEVQLIRQRRDVRPSVRSHHFESFDNIRLRSQESRSETCLDGYVLRDGAPNEVKRAHSLRDCYCTTAGRDQATSRSHYASQSRDLILWRVYSLRR